MKYLSCLLTTLTLACLMPLQACSDDGGGSSGGDGNAGSGGTSSGGTTSATTGSSADPCDSCNGCCMGTTCVELAKQSDAACGRSGDQCESCITGEVCVEGKCIIDSGQCSPASCPTGCCKGTVCVQRSDQSWLACGTEAGECETCNTATICDHGVCTDVIARGDLIRIRINAVEVDTTDDGEEWDLLGGAPDLFVCVTDGVFEGCTTAGSDTFAVEWASDGMLVDSAGAEVFFSTDDLIDGNLEFGVFDDDVAGRHLGQAGFLSSISVFEDEYTIREQAPNLSVLTFSLY